MTQFRYTVYARNIIFGLGALAQLYRPWNGLVGGVCCCVPPGQPNGRGRVARIEDGLGERLADVYDHVQPHVQDLQLFAWHRPSRF